MFLSVTVFFHLIIISFIYGTFLNTLELGKSKQQKRSKQALPFDVFSYENIMSSHPPCTK
ncbi:hypothetical protein ABP1_0973 [Bacillus subtilis]|nr:hypothetical protein ABP1_0973 [Bacillus subtilis]